MAASGNLALSFEQIFTVIVRVRSNRQVARNAEIFRANIRGLLKQAEQESTTRGYSSDDTRLASFAVVAFLDESLLASSDPVFADWRRMPLQMELFKTGNAGEEFFKGLDVLLKRRDVPQLADLLETYYLCLLLGFRGRGSSESLRGAKGVLSERIRRIRGPVQPLCNSWAPSAGVAATAASDPWIGRLAVVAGASLMLAFLLFVVFKLTLPAG